jgi:hypothetical protein
MGGMMEVCDDVGCAGMEIGSDGWMDVWRVSSYPAQRDRPLPAFQSR